MKGKDRVSFLLPCEEIRRCKKATLVTGLPWSHDRSWCSGRLPPAGT